MNFATFYKQSINEAFQYSPIMNRDEIIAYIDDRIARDQSCVISVPLQTKWLMGCANFSCYVHHSLGRRYSVSVSFRNGVSSFDDRMNRSFNTLDQMIDAILRYQKKAIKLGLYNKKED